jgi:DNA-binding transcriptional ArsR family regulator
MPRAATTSDVFSAIAEPRRRDIIDLLARGHSHGVNDLAASLRLPQPAVSKHLGVLRKVGLVSARREGQRRIYHLNPKELKPVHDWSKTFERYWSSQLDRIKAAAERKAKNSDKPSASPAPESHNHKESRP